MQGWIKLHRKIIDSPIYCDPLLLKLWMLCLIKATHKEYEQLIGNQVVHLKPGQFVTGRQSLSEEFNRGMKPSQKVAESTLWRWLNNFEKWQKVNIKKTNKYSVITILNWDVYQESEQQVNNKWTSNEQQMDTNKNVKNLKNVKNVDVVEEQSISFEGMPTPQDAVPTFEIGADSSQKKISKSDYEKHVIDKYLKLRQATCLSPNDEIALKEIVAEKISLTTVLEGIEKAFDEYIPKHSRDKIKSLKYCVPIIFDLQYVKNSNPSEGNKSSNSYKTKNRIKKDILPPWIEEQSKREREHQKETIKQPEKDERDGTRNERIRHLLKELGELDEEDEGIEIDHEGRSGNGIKKTSFN
jgi:hypothetical protein